MTAPERTRDDLVGGGHDAAQVARFLVTRDQFAAGGRQLVADHRLEAVLECRDVLQGHRQQALGGEAV